MLRVGKDTSLLQVAVLGKSWAPRLPLLGPLHFSLAAGEVVALCGPSGCGKSTLLSMIAGLDQDFDGRIGLAPGARLGIVFQTPRLLPWRTAIENVALGRPGDPAGRDLAGPLLRSVGLGEAADRYPAQLSLGMAHRVALARALIGEPDILLLDEAMASLDGETAATLHRCLLERVLGHGMAVLMVTHDRRDAEALADRVLQLGGQPTGLLQQQKMAGIPLSRRKAGVTPPFAKPLPAAARGSFPL